MGLGNEGMSYGGEFLSLCREGMSCIADGMSPIFARKISENILLTGK